MNIPSESEPATVALVEFSAYLKDATAKLNEAAIVIVELKQELTRTQDALSYSEQKTKELVDEILERENEELKVRISEQDETIGSLQNLVDDLRHVELKKANDKANELEIQVSIRDTQIGTLRGRIESLEEQVSDLKNTLRAVGKEN
jgi:chromosome segregation ATPase